MGEIIVSEIISTKTIVYDQLYFIGSLVVFVSKTLQTLLVL